MEEGEIEDENGSVRQEAERLFEAKKEWRRKQVKLPMKEKVRILLKMQKDDYPILLKRGVLKSWEKPWKIEP